MAYTLLDVVQIVSEKVGLDSSVTSFSVADESQLLVGYVNEAYRELLRELPDNSPYLSTEGSITTANGTRVYTLGSGVLTTNLNNYSFENETLDDARLNTVTLEYLQSKDPKFDETTGVPHSVYTDGANQLGFYPVPDATYTIKFRYSAKDITDLSATTDTFLVPDGWVWFIIKRAQEHYERFKVMADPDQTQAAADEIMTKILIEEWENQPTYMLDGNGLGGY